MRDYITRRLLLVIPTLLLVALIVFFFIRAIPGDAVEMMVATMDAEGAAGGIEAAMEAIRHELGLDLPVHIQFVRWLGNVVRGDLGVGLWSHIPVTEELANRLPVSLELTLLALIVSLSISLPIGIYSAIRQDTWGDYVGRSFAITCIAVPAFWLGTLVWVFPAIWWGWSPEIEFIRLFDNPIENLKIMIIPATIAGMVTSGVTMRMTRTMMLEVLRQDYVRTAWAKGLHERTVIVRHALKNALIPVVTLVGLQIPVLIGSLLIIEQIFCLPGIGRYMLAAITQRDYPVISGINLLMATIVLSVNLVVDLTYAFLDPRVRYR